MAAGGLLQLVQRGGLPPPPLAALNVSTRCTNRFDPVSGTSHILVVGEAVNRVSEIQTVVVSYILILWFDLLWTVQQIKLENCTRVP